MLLLIADDEDDDCVFVMMIMIMLLIKFLIGMIEYGHVGDDIHEVMMIIIGRVMMKFVIIINVTMMIQMMKLKHLAMEKALKFSDTETPLVQQPTLR